jgi:two-component system invasion response regulator UvrY
MSKNLAESVADPCRVLLADDHAVVRAGFGRLLEMEADIQVVGEAESGQQCIEMFETLRPDVVIMDIAMPGMDGMEAMRQILSSRNDARILILSYHEEAIFAERALEGGAAGYLRKSAAPELLYSAIRKISEGGKYVDPYIAQEMVLRQTSGSRDPLTLLSEREFTIFLQIAEGKSIAVIADELNISPNTVNTYFSRIRRKLNVSSKTELTRIAIRENLLNP